MLYFIALICLAVKVLLQQKDIKDVQRRLSEAERRVIDAQVEVKVLQKSYTSPVVHFEPVPQTPLNDMEALAKAPDLKLGNRFISGGMAAEPFDQDDDLL